MAVVLAPIGAGFQFFGGNTADSNPNLPLVGGLLNVYAAGTTTPVTTYTSSAGNIANSNPIVLDSAGRVPFEIWWAAGSSYKFVLQDPLGNNIPNGTWDNIPGINDVGLITGFTKYQGFTATAGQTVFTLTLFTYTTGQNQIQVYRNGAHLNPADYTETSSTVVTLTTGAIVGDLIDFYLYSGIGQTGATGAGINWRGAWSSLTAYVANDAVSYSGNSYVCVLANTNQTPPVPPAGNTTYWNYMAQQPSAVTSVALSDASSTPIYAISGSPVTSTGTLTMTLNTETANRVFSGPTTGVPAQPTFRALVAADIPALSYVTSVGVASAGASSAAITVSGSPVTGSGTISLTPNLFGASAAGIVPASGGGTTAFLRADGTWVTPAGSGTVTNTSGNLTANAVVIGNGGSDEKVLASLGTTTTVLHGNAAGAPSFSAVSLTADVSGVLPTANGGTNNANLTFPSGTVSIGYLNIPQNSQSVAYTTVATDEGKCIFHPSSDANARTYTIDSNANVPYELGAVLTFCNRSANAVTIAITSDTLTWSPTGGTGSRTLAQYGVATAMKIATTEWLLTGTGLT